MEDIFELEREVIQEAESLLHLKTFSSEEDEDRYKKLLKAYKRLLKQMQTMVKMSDIMQSKLNSMSSELEKLSQIDGLTGLYNRRFFNEIYLREWKKSVAAGTTLGAMMIDIDYFKVYNDTYGHLAGDECLRKIAGSIGQTVEDLDVHVGRFGGEEFILLLPGADVGKCSEIAQKIMDDIAELSIPSAVKTIGGYVTVSVGIGLITPLEDTKPESLINVADQALYRAKKDGRNCWRL